MEKIIIGTTNPKKVEQMRQALSELSDKYEFIGLNDINYTKDIVEDGKNIGENSLKKARTICQDTGIATISDDTGFFINCLNGEPGIFAGRYLKSFPEPKKENCLKEVIKRVSSYDNKSCYYECVISLVFPNGKEITVNGKLEGTIDNKITNLETGFDYDCIFVSDVYHKPLSVLSNEELIKINHRGKAIQELIKILKK